MFQKKQKYLKKYVINNKWLRVKESTSIILFCPLYSIGAEVEVKQKNNPSISIIPFIKLETLNNKAELSSNIGTIIIYFNLFYATKIVAKLVLVDIHFLFLNEKVSKYKRKQSKLWKYHFKFGGNILFMYLHEKRIQRVEMKLSDR